MADNDDDDVPPPAEEKVAGEMEEEEEGETTVTGAMSSLAIASSSAADDANNPVPPPPAANVRRPEDAVVDVNDDDVDEDYDPDEDDDIDIIDDEAYANEFLSLLPSCVLPRIERLKALNAKRDTLMEEYKNERAELEMKYAKMILPLYDERRDVVNGEYDNAIREERWMEDRKKKTGGGGGGGGEKEKVGSEEEGGGGGGGGGDDDDDVAAEEGEGGGEEEEAVKGIPQFWACAMGHVDVIAELITEADVDCLEHLTDVTCIDFPDGLGFELNFHFSTNDFFHNTVLTKRYEVPNLLTEDEPILKNVTGTDIKWKKDRSLTYREVTKKQRKKGGPKAGQVRSITKRERTESFFHFFTPMKMPALSDDIDEDEADAVEEAFDHDYDVAQAFRSHLIRKAVLWFTGEAMMEDDYDEDGMMGGEEGEGDGGDDGEEGRPRQFAFGGGGDNDPFPKPPAGDGENPECKQN